MLSKYLSSALVPASRQSLFWLANKRTNLFTQFQRNDVRNLNRTSSRFYSDEYHRKAVEKFFKTQSGDNSAQSAVYYSMALVALTVGLSYAAVPLYRLFCQVNFRNFMHQVYG